jgi:hypothetical protein
MLIVPLRPLPRQTTQCQLGGQPVVISVYQFQVGLFVDISVGAVPVVGGVIAQSRNRLVRYAYYGFVGDLIFIDTQGDDDPVYTGLGTRWQLTYLEAADLATAGL